MSLYMSEALFKNLQGTAWQEKIEDGYLAFLTDDFRPHRPKHKFPRQDMTIVTARIDPQLHEAVGDYARTHSDDIGWIPTPRQVAVAWLMHIAPPSASSDPNPSWAA